MVYEEEDWLEEEASLVEDSPVDLSGEDDDELFDEDFGEEGHYGEEE